VTGEPSLAERLVALFDHLGIVAAHVATAMPANLAGLATTSPERIAGVVLCAPSRLDPMPFAGLARRLLLIAGEAGPTAELAARAMPRLDGAERHVLRGCDAPGSWADVVAEHPEEIAARMTGFLGHFAATPPQPPAAEGVHAGITYRVSGAGPALLLLPLALARSQWEPAVPLLARHFTVVTLGGPHLGSVAQLEDRARLPTYRAMFRSLIDLMMPQPGEPILEIGCGAGSLVRLLARRLGDANPITGADLNPYLLREAAALTAAEGLVGHIEFAEGNAEELPFPDDAFGCVYSVTVFEECDAERALAEAVRVARPGGRVGIVVRALDMPQWWNLDLPEAIRAKVTMPPYSVAPRGVADKSLYRRMRAAGLDGLVCFPALVTLDRPQGPMWRNREDYALSLLNAEEAAIWRGLADRAKEEGLLFMANPLHCAVGRKQ
jgi:SAM-dependent methyltransferase